MFYATAAKPKMTIINHEEQKNQLESRLKKMIHTYENRNKELSMEMHRLEDQIDNKTHQKPKK